MVCGQWMLIVVNLTECKTESCGLKLNGSLFVCVVESNRLFMAKTIQSLCFQAMNRRMFTDLRQTLESRFR